MLVKTKHALNVIQNSGIALEKRPLAIATALGCSLSSQLLIPTSAIENINAYFNHTHRNEVLDILNEINEVVVFNIDYALMLVEKMYVLRFAFVHRPNRFTTERALLALAATDSVVIPENVQELLLDANDRVKLNTLGADLCSIVKLETNDDINAVDGGI